MFSVKLWLSQDAYPRGGLRWYLGSGVGAAKFLASLPSANDSVEEGCVICRGYFGADDPGHKPVKLPCGHVFGETCIKHWLAPVVDDVSPGFIPLANMCPYCRHVCFEKVTTPDALADQERRLRLWDLVYHALDIDRNALEEESRTDLWKFVVSQRALEKTLGQNQEFLKKKQFAGFREGYALSRLEKFASGLDTTNKPSHYEVLVIMLIHFLDPLSMLTANVNLFNPEICRLDFMDKQVPTGGFALRWAQKVASSWDEDYEILDYQFRTGSRTTKPTLLGLNVKPVIGSLKLLANNLPLTKSLKRKRPGRSSPSDAPSGGPGT